MSPMIRFFLSSFLFVCATFTSSAQVPAASELHMPSAFDNSFAGTLTGGGHARSVGEERYGFSALFEVRVSPGVVKTLAVRQYFASEEHAVQGFLRVRTSLSGSAHLVHVNWISPTEGGELIGN